MQEFPVAAEKPSSIVVPSSRLDTSMLFKKVRKASQYSKKPSSEVVSEKGLQNSNVLSKVDER